MPTVSMVALCFNHRRFVTDCLDGMAAQTFDDRELVIVDDASTDGSPELIREWLDRTGTPATFIARTSNGGICAALNDAISHCSGDVIAMSATDDLWEPDKLARHVAILEGDPAAAVVYSDAVIVDEGGVRTGRHFLETYAVDPAQAPAGAVTARLLRGNFIPAMTTSIRRTALDEVGPYDESLPYEDWDMWLRLSRHHRFLFDGGAPTASYRVLDRSLMRSMVPTLGFRRAQVAIPQKWIDDPDPAIAEAARAKMGLELRALYAALPAAAVPGLTVLAERSAERSADRSADRSVRRGGRWASRWSWLALAARARVPYLWARRAEKAVDKVVDAARTRMTSSRP